MRYYLQQICLILSWVLLMLGLGLDGTAAALRTWSVWVKITWVCFTVLTCIVGVALACDWLPQRKTDEEN